MPLAARGAVAAPQPAPQPHGNGLVLAAFMEEDVVLFEEDFLRHLVMHPPTPPGDSCCARKMFSARRMQWSSKYEESLRFPPTNYMPSGPRGVSVHKHRGEPGHTHDTRRSIHDTVDVGTSLSGRGTLHLDEKTRAISNKPLTAPFSKHQRTYANAQDPVQRLCYMYLQLTWRGRGQT